MKKLLYLAVLLVAMPAQATYTIIIDPGHGGPRCGTSSPSKKIIEKEAALEIALALAKQLREKGHTVILTRETDRALDEHNLMDDLKKRAQMTTDYKADIFLSIHLNGSFNKSSRGFEVYVPYEDKYPIKSYALAAAIHYDLSHEVEPEFGGGNLGNLNSLDRGIKASRFNVIKRATCPAVLAELAYISNPATEEKLLKEGYGLYVTALYKGINRYIVHNKKE